MSHFQCLLVPFEMLVNVNTCSTAVEAYELHERKNKTNCTIEIMIFEKINAVLS